MVNNQYIEMFKQQARSDLLSFCVYTDKNFDVINIHERMAEEIQQVIDGKTKNLILQLPPRSGKSRIMQESVAYTLGNNPELDILLTGHSASLLESFSRNIRNRINSVEYQQLFNTKLADGNTAVKSWKTNGNGEFSIFGVGGGITGKGGNILIIDDPYAGREDAESKTIREKVYDWYKSTFLSRKHNKDASVIIIMQRWREDDLVGKLLEENPDKWKVVKFPAVNEDNESFWPEKFPIDYLDDIKSDMGTYFFQSQYQQDPIAIGSGAFVPDMFEYYTPDELEPVKKRLNVVTFIDPAISQKQEADSTAIVTIGTDSETNYTYILEVKKLKEQPDAIIDELFYTVNDYKDFGNHYKVGIEVVQYQKMLALEIRKQMRLRDTTFLLQELRPTGEKEARIVTALQGRYSNHMIIHPKRGANIQDLETELLKFPKGSHDDMIDALASAMVVSTVKNVAQKKRRVSTPNWI